MRVGHTFLFGYGSHGHFIAYGLQADNLQFRIIESNKDNYQLAQNEGYKDTLLIDVTSDTQLSKLSIDQDDKIICVMEDEHLNVFLTLSLRALYPSCSIYAISNSLDTSQKLKMAGANQIIDLYEVSAKRISNLLKKPIATKLLDSFLSHPKGISFREITLPKDSLLLGRLVNNIEYKSYGVLLVGVVIFNTGEFGFVTHGITTPLQYNDILVCIGDEEDLKKFEEKIIKKEEIL